MIFAGTGLLERVSTGFLLVLVAILSLFMLLTLIKLIIGPSAADRLLFVNVLGSMVISTIAVISILLGESYLLDISILYALLSFLAVVVFAQLYITEYRKRNRGE